MTKIEKANIKYMLREWGNCNKIIRTQSAEIMEFKRVYDKLEHIKHKTESTIGGECEIISIDELRKQVSKMDNSLNNRLSMKSKLDDIINDMPYDIRAILNARYVKGYSWELIPVNLPFVISVRQCYRLHNTALEIIHQRLCNENTDTSAL
jgi:hypothetical protein